MNYLYPLTAIHVSGCTEMLRNEEAVRAFYRKHGRWNENHIDYYYDFRSSRVVHVKRVHNWIVRDDLGKPVSPDHDFGWGRKDTWYTRRAKEIKAYAEKGLPIPRTGCSKAGWKINHVAKKNSGAGHRNRNRALADADFREFGIKNNLGRVTPWEGY